MKSPPVVIAAPAGSPDRLNSSDCGGDSGSDAVAVNVSRVSSSTACGPIGSRTGGVLSTVRKNCTL